MEYATITNTKNIKAPKIKPKKLFVIASNTKYPLPTTKRKSVKNNDAQAEALSAMVIFIDAFNVVVLTTRCLEALRRWETVQRPVSLISIRAFIFAGLAIIPEATLNASVSKL